MTIKPKIEVSLSAKAAGYRFVISDAVGVVSISARRDRPEVSLTDVTRICVQRFSGLLHGWLQTLQHHSIRLFTATPFWEQHGAARRNRGIWTDRLKWISRETACSSSIEIQGLEGTRFAGLVAINDINLFDAADFVRQERSSFLCVSSRALTEEWVRMMFGYAFPQGESGVNWGSIVSQLENTSDDIYVRITGNFDDAEATIDTFVCSDQLRRLTYS